MEFASVLARLCSTFMETKLVQALMRVMKQDGSAVRLLNMKAGVPVNHEKRSETLCTFVGAVIIMRAFFVAFPNARVLLHGGIVHRYDQATRQLVPVDDDEQSMFEEQQRQAGM